MSIFSIQNETFILQLICVNICIGQGQKLEAKMNVHMEPTSENYEQYEIFETNYKQFQDTFFDNRTKSVNLKFGFTINGRNRYIVDIDKQVTNDDNMFLYYFRCSVNQSTSSIQCNRNVPSNIFGVNVCLSGFGISWLYENEYLISEHFQNSTKYCASSDKLTCYRLINIDTTTSTLISTTAASKKVSTDTSSLVQLTTTESTESSPLYTFTSTNTSFISTMYWKDNKTDQTAFSSTRIIADVATTSFNTVNTDSRTTMSIYKLISTPLYTISSLSSTVYLNDYPTERTIVDTNAVIAGVTVSVVIIFTFVVIVIIIFMKRKVKKESPRNEDIPNSILELANSSFSDSIYSLQVLPLDEHNNCKSTGSNVIDNNKSNTNNYTDALSKVKTRDTVFRSISDSHYRGIDGGQSSTLPGILLSIDQGCDGDYTTIGSNQGSKLSRTVARDVDDGKCNTEGNNSSLNLEHPASLIQEEYAKVNKNVGYKNLSEILQNKNHAAVHDYNNITDNNATNETTEPAKQVYSKLRENIRHFENTYGDLGVYMQAEENNSTLANDNTYFILKAEEIHNGQK